MRAAKNTTVGVPSPPFPPPLSALPLTSKSHTVSLPSPPRSLLCLPMETALIERLEAAVARLEVVSATAGSSPSLREGVGGRDDPADPATSALDELLEGPLARLRAAGDKIGGKVAEVTGVLAEAFAVERDLLAKAKQTKKPDLAGLQEFLKPLNEVMVKANAMTEGKRFDFFNHVKTVADSLSALVWIAYTGKDCGMSLPISHVEESWQMAEFYNNKILVEYRNKDANHVEWAKSLKELYLPGLRDYVKKFYPLGPVWGAFTNVSVPPPATVAATSKAPPSKAPPPPPPPQPPSGSLFTPEPPSSHPKEGMSAVFQEISSGKPVTAGLRKVTDDMKSKNRANRTSVVVASENETRSSSFSLKTGPPKLELQMGRKWAVENQIGKKNLVIDDCDPKQSVYIFGCKDSVLQVKGKVNNITLDKCTKVGVLFTDVVAACEVVNCNRVEVQCQGNAPTISVDNTSGCQLYLCKESLGTSISTAKSSEINVMVPGSGPDSDWVECSLPQQFVHVFKAGQFTTTPASHSGG